MPAAAKESLRTATKTQSSQNNNNNNNNNNTFFKIEGRMRITKPQEGKHQDRSWDPRSRGSWSTGYWMIWQWHSPSVRGEDHIACSEPLWKRDQVATPTAFYLHDADNLLSYEAYVKNVFTCFNCLIVPSDQEIGKSGKNPKGTECLLSHKIILCMLQTEWMCHLKNVYVETVFPSVMVFGVGALRGN